MSTELIVFIGAGIAGIAGVFFLDYYTPVFRKIRQQLIDDVKQNPDKYKSLLRRITLNIYEITDEELLDYSTRVGNAVENIKRASIEMDRVMQEFASISAERQKTIDLLEGKLIQLSEQESMLNQKIQSLEKVPLEAIRHFEETLTKGDRRSARRDYLLFILGILASVIVTFILKALHVA